MTGLFVKAIAARNVALSHVEAKLARFSREESGATAVEYALIVGLIAVAIIVAVTALGGSLTTLFQKAICGVRGGTWTTSCSISVA